MVCAICQTEIKEDEQVEFIDNSYDECIGYVHSDCVEKPNK